MSSNKMNAVVFGVTGLQGSSVARALARCGDYHVRGVTRDHTSSKAQVISRDGVELINCDFNDETSLRATLCQADVCFINTITVFDDANCLDSEIALGCRIARACQQEGVKHVVYSSQLNCYKVCGLMARHLVAKAEIEEYMISLKLPLTCLIVPVYYEQFMTIFKPITCDGRNYEVELPMGTTPLDMMSVYDLGTAVLCAIRQRDQYLNKTLSVCGDKLTTREVAHVLSTYLRPRAFKDKQITAHEWVHRHSDILGCSDWANMFQFLQRVDQKYNLASTKRLNVGLRSFDAWVRENIPRFNNVL